ncbi:MAG: hypothetical protein CMJ48_10805 [Planctomycetaceae bacterium]|nr:hypothetical protein [Planctomycetaceae bacterium]
MCALGRIRQESRVRVPMVPISAAFALGVFVDTFDVVSLPMLMIGTGAAVIGCLVLRRRTIVLVLVAWFCLGGIRHYASQKSAHKTDLMGHAADDVQLVKLIGTIDERPQVVVRDASDGPAWGARERTDLTLELEQFLGTHGAVPVSGLARTSVEGRVEGIDVGDRVVLTGRNPGGFDYREHLWLQRTGSVVRTNSEAGLSVIDQSGPLSIWRLRGVLRERCESLLDRHLTEENSVIAKAMLLGDRSNLPEDVRRAFAESGTLHFLAVSGLHVGILAGLLWMCGRVLRLSPVGLAVLLVVGTVGYAFVTDGRPPVIRATILVVITAVGIPMHRRSLSANSLALASLIVLTFDPGALFKTGAQLSFLAVVAIICSAPWCRSIRERGREFRHSPEGENRGWFLRGFDWSVVWLKCSYLMTLTIVLFTTPLVASEFHLVSPVGLLVNVLLIPIVAAALWLGFGLLFVGMLAPSAAAPFAWGVDLSLLGLSWVVEAASGTPLGHRHVPGISSDWLMAYYGLLGAAVLWRRMRPWSWWCLCLWTIAGLAAALVPRNEDELRCTFLSVGHGCAVVVEFPDGQTLLYDCGSILGGRRAAQAVSDLLVQRGKIGLNGVVVSHADVDHYNGLRDLLGLVPVRSVAFGQSFLDFGQKGVSKLCEFVDESQIPMQIVRTGDCLRVGRDVEVRVLLADAGSPRARDNEQSVVIEFLWAGRRLLLTGDLEGAGLARLLAEQSRPVDVLMSPHHGSPAANTAELARWASPSVVVVSDNRRETRDKLQALYGAKTRVFSTQQSGSVTVTIPRSGEIRIRQGVRQTGRNPNHATSSGSKSGMLMSSS